MILAAIIALAAGGLIVVMLAIAHVESEDAIAHVESEDDHVSNPPASSDPPVQPQLTTQRPPRHSAVWWRWTHRRTVVYPRARWRWSFDKSQAKWIPVAVAGYVVLGYLIVHT